MRTRCTWAARNLPIGERWWRAITRRPWRGWASRSAPARASRVSIRWAFLFSGQGTQYVNMGQELYQSEPVFKKWIDRCAELARPHLGLDLRELIYPTGDATKAAEELKLTWNAQPVLFAVEYALAQLWLSWGIKPAKLIGHSLGEYPAACLAGIFSLEDAVALVCARGALMKKVSAGRDAGRLAERGGHPAVDRGGIIAGGSERAGAVRRLGPDGTSISVKRKTGGAAHRCASAGNVPRVPFGLDRGGGGAVRRISLQEEIARAENPARLQRHRHVADRGGSD